MSQRPVTLFTGQWADLKIADYLDKDVFYELFAENAFGKVEAVFHEGACSDTMESDGKYMMDNNYTLSCGLFNACQQAGTRLLYASSAATYGGSDYLAAMARRSAMLPVPRSGKPSTTSRVGSPPVWESMIWMRFMGSP